MANMYGVSTAKFKPFTFDEMLKAPLMSTEAHNQLEENYSNLATVTAQLEDKLKSNPKDAKLRMVYEEYRDALKLASEELYNKGLSAQSRRTFTQLKNDYASKIDPINKAYAKYQEQQDIINKLALTNPEIIVTGAGDSISDYMGDKKLELASVNLDKLMTQAMAGAKTDATRTHRVSKWKSTAGGKFMERVEEIGLSDAEFEAAMNNIEEHKFNKNVKLSENAKSILKIIENVASSSNYGLLTGADKERADNAILTGIRAGYAYDKKVQTQSNPGYAYARAAAEQRKKQQDALKKAIREGVAEIGSDKFITTAEGKNEFIKRNYTNSGNLKKEYTNYFNSEDKLKSREDIVNEVTKQYNQEQKAYSDKRSTYDYGIENIGQNFNSSYLYTDQNKNKYVDVGNTLDKRISNALEEYDSFVESLSLIGLNGKDLNLKQINDQLDETPDSIHATRYDIPTDAEASKAIQTNIEGALGGDTVQQIIGIVTDENGKQSYKTSDIDFEDLLDKEGVLNVISVNSLFGQGSIKVKTQKGNIEIIIPKNAYQNENTVDNMKLYETKIEHAENGEILKYTVDENGNPIYKYEKVDPRDVIQTEDGFEGTISEYEDYLKLLEYNLLKTVMRKHKPITIGG